MTAKGAVPDASTSLMRMLAAALKDLPPGPIAIAVSGGGDSLALLDLALSVLPGAGFNLHVATVDHGLRTNSPAEARGVSDFCRVRGLPHVILNWAEGVSIAQSPGNLMDAARQARERLIAGWARAQGIDTVLLGHTADDQAEGFVINLARSAGIDGLAGMRARFDAQGIHWRRPLLAARRLELRDHLRARGINWVDDPTNDDDRFTRARARKVLGSLAALGINAAQISASVSHLQSARMALQLATTRAAQKITRVEAAALVISGAAFDDLPAEIRRRLVQSVISWISGAGYPPRGPALDRLIAGLQAGKSAQLAGLRFMPRIGTSDQREIWAAPEMRSLHANPGRFARRWRLADAPIGLNWAPIGPEGLRQFPGWRGLGLPRMALEPGPGLWRGGDLVSAPALNQPNPAQFGAEIAQSLADFIGVH